VTLGGVALEALKTIEGHEFSLRKDVAQVHEWNQRLLVPLYHPSPQVLITSRDEKAQLRDYEAVSKAILDCGVQAGRDAAVQIWNR